MSKELIAKLEATLNDAVSGLKNTTSKKMFGCHAVWVNENVFALVWKTGRIGFKLPDEKAYDSLMSKDGAAPWTAGPKTMAHWLLVPETYHSKPAALKKLAAQSYDLCSVLVPKAKTAAKRTLARPAKKSAIPMKKGK